LRFALHIALSHLRSKRHEAGVSAITLISVVGVTIGVGALIIVLSVMAGFEVDMREKILGSNAHIVVMRYGGTVDDVATLENGGPDGGGGVRGVPGVVGVTPFVYTEAMIYAGGHSKGVVLKGIDTAKVGEVLDLQENLVMGLDGPPETDEDRRIILESINGPVGTTRHQTGPSETGKPHPGIIIGEELSQTLRVMVGDKVHVVNPIGGGMGPFGAPVPTARSFRVAGIFYSGMFEYDTSWTYIAIPEAQKFLGWKDEVNGLEITVEDIYQADDVALRIEEAVGYPYYTRHWQTLNKSLFDALKLEKVVMGLILFLIVTVASLNVVSTLILIVLSKGREIAIMKAMGASSRQIRVVFMLEGTIIGLIGSVLGTILGLAGSLGLQEYGFPLNTDVYYVDSLPVVIQPGLVAAVAFSSVAICFLATLYPATRAGNLNPVEGLRYE
jgi:lipoprotein-releasing system permease protein